VSDCCADIHDCPPLRLANHRVTEANQTPANAFGVIVMPPALPSRLQFEAFGDSKRSGRIF
jgi:hypothetical protein